MKNFYIEYVHLRNSHNNYERFIDSLFLQENRKIVSKEEIITIVDNIKDMVKKEHEKEYSRCKDVHFSFFGNEDDMVLCTEVSRVFFLSIKER